MGDRVHWFVAAAIFLLAVALYLPVAEFDYINYDDHRYVSQNDRIEQGLTFENISWAFTTLELANWHPLTWLSYMLDTHLFGPRQPGGAHIVNVLLHAINAALLLALLRRLTGSLWRSAFVSALFALHPLHVESVAWISERKDVLSTLFGIIAIWFYAEYVRSMRSLDFAFVVVGLAVSLLAKPMLVTLPVLLLLLDFWPLKRLQTGGDVVRLTLEKWPLIVLCAVSCVVTIIAQNAGGALRSFTYYPPETRIVNALVCYAIYLYQSIWPVNLAVFYPHPKHWPIWSIVLSALTLSLLSLVALRTRKGHPYVLFGWLWYVVSLLPVIGLVQVGGQAHADRYTYVPSIGLFVLIAWSLRSATRIARWGSMAFACVVLLALIMPLRLQINHWRNDRSLAEHTLRVTGENEVAYLLLGNVLLDEGNFASAAEHFGAAARLQPNWADAHNNLGNALAHQGETTRAVQAYRRAIEIQPELADAHYNLGVVLHRDKKLEEGLQELELAIALDPRHQAAFIQLGAILRDMGRLVDAVDRFETAVALRPNDPVALINLADAQAKVGQRDRAVDNFRKTAEIAETMGDGSLHKQALDRLAELGATTR